MEAEENELKYILPRDEVLGNCSFMKDKYEQFDAQIEFVLNRDKLKKKAQQDSSANSEFADASSDSRLSP